MLLLNFKVVFLVILAVFIRGTLPRYRVDQLISLNWKFFIFICVFFYIELVIFILFS
jgi:NADH:ubiquinone oxidoreductase subunit H